MEKKSIEQEKARTLRQQGESIKEIAKFLGVSVGSVSAWVRGISLTSDQQERLKEKKPTGKKNKDISVFSKFWIMARSFETMSTSHKGGLAETAVLFRILLVGLEAFKSPVDGNRIDWIVRNPKTNKTVTIQVKLARSGKFGKPYIENARKIGHAKFKKYDSSDFDFMVGYDLKSDTAFIIPMEILIGKRTIAMTPESAENWNLIQGAVA